MSKRNITGIKSPPVDYIEDDMTLGPVLPEGWDGDAWKRENTNGYSYWLRAWNKQTSRIVISKASTYEAARELLLEDINNGGS